MKLTLYWSYATRSLVRGGQRTVLAIFCVAVGVMAIVALQLVSLSVNQALLGNIVEANGGDIRLSADITPLRQRDLAVLDKLKQRGRITDYATAYDAGGSITRPSGDEETFSFIAVSPNFPLVGQPNFIAPSHNLSVQNVVNGNNVAMSSLVFQHLDAHIGSTYRVKTLDGRLVSITVAAEFQEAGAFLGPQVLISQSTLAAVPGPSGTPLPAQYGTVYMTVPGANINSVKTELGQALPSVGVITAKDLLARRQSQVNQIELFLRIVGLLALFIGGIGIINTMQVLLRRRQVEIAMLKTTGYRQIDLYALFGLEAALLGFAGGIVGTSAGVGASYLVRTVVENAFFLHLTVVLDSLTISSGLLIGVSTALIFGLLPIVQASQIRPLAVLREISEGTQTSSRLTTIGLLILLSVLFVALASTILGDLVTAVVAVYGGFGVIFALALGFGLLVLAISKLPVYERPRPRILLWILLAIGAVVVSSLLLAGLGLLGVFANDAATRLGYSVIGTYALVVLGGLGIILVGGSLVFFIATLVNTIVMFMPRSWKTAVMLAYRNMGRQRIRTTTTLTALFVGVFAIGLILVLGQGIKDTIHKNIRSTDKIDKGDVLGSMSDIEGFNLNGDKNNLPTLVLKSGRNLRGSDAGTNNVVMSSILQNAPVRLHLGDTIIVQSVDGSVTRALKVVGFYDGDSQTGNANFAGVLADTAVTEQLGGSVTLEVFSLKVDPDQLPAFKQHLNKAVPAAVIFSVIDIDALINQVLNNLIIMLTTVASLAMIAGLIIIANAVALAMLERRREIGILKSVGHTSTSILATVLIENGLVGTLGSLVAMLLVTGAIVALSNFVFHIAINFGAGLIGLIIGSTALLTMLVATFVAWGAVRVRPLDVLRYE